MADKNKERSKAVVGGREQWEDLTKNSPPDALLVDIANAGLATHDPTITTVDMSQDRSGRKPPSPKQSG